MSLELAIVLASASRPASGGVARELRRTPGPGSPARPGLGATCLRNEDRWPAMLLAGETCPQGRTPLRLCYDSCQGNYHLPVPDTELLYATDAYVRTFDAHVEEVTADGGVILHCT